MVSINSFGRHLSLADIDEDADEDKAPTERRLPDSDGKRACPCPFLPARLLKMQCPPCPLPDKS